MIGICLTVLGLVFISFVGMPLPGLALTFLGVSFLGFSLARITRRSLKARLDPYDLGALRRIDEQDRLSQSDPGEVSLEAEEIFCLHCGSAYKVRFPVCPNCGRMP